MDNRCFQIRSARVALGTLLAMVFAVPVAGAAGGHDPVASDGSSVELAEFGPQHGVSGSRGSRVPGQSLDALAEFPASRATKLEMEAMATTFRAPVPLYARDRPVQESVIGDDARYRIYPSASGFPERAIGQITFTRGSDSFICTGWLINANTVATAGHCVHSGGSSGAWSSNVRFYPGRDGATSPYGYCSARRLFSVTGWTASGSENFDYGAIKLNCTIGNTTGWFGFFWQSASLVGLPVQVSGYPGDKGAGTQWSGSGDVEVAEVYKTRYRIDTAGGQSGGPVFETDRIGSFCTGACANTIHAYGASGGRNSGTRITQVVYNNLMSWRNAP